MARLLVVLVLIVVVVAGLGYYLDWFHVRVQEEKIQRDMEVAREKARQLGTKVEEKAKDLGRKAQDLGERAREGVKTVAQLKTAKGRIQQVDPADHRFVMRTTEGEDLTVYTDAASKIQQGDQDLRLDELRPGDHATVAYRVNDGKSFAASVTIVRE